MYSFTFDLITRQTVWNLLLGGICKWLAYIGFNQICVQRLISLPNIGQARRYFLVVVTILLQSYFNI